MLIAVAALAILAIIWWAFRESSESAVQPGAPPKIEAVAAGTQRETPEPSPAEEETALTRAALEPEQGPSDSDATVTGRFVDAESSPLEGVEISLQARAKREVTVRPREEIGSATTPRSGRFSFAFEPVPAWQYTMAAVAKGHVSASWRLGELVAGETRDLGDLKLPPAGTVLVRLLDREGSPILGGWQGILQEASTDPDSVRRAVFLDARPEERTGICRFEGAPAGAVLVGAQLDPSEIITPRKVQVTAGEELRVDLEYRGPDPSRRIWLVVGVRPFLTVHPEHRFVTLRGPGLERKPNPAPFTTNTPTFDDVPPGSYTVSIEDPRFRPWRMEGVTPGGGRIDALLKGTSALELSVTDGSTGGPATGYGVYLEPREVNVYPPRITLLEPGAPPPAQGLFDGLVAGSYDLVIEHPELAPLRSTVLDLQPDEVRPLAVRLVRGGVIAGRVLEPDRTTPVANQAVELYLAAEIDDGPATGYLNEDRVHRASESSRKRLRLWTRAVSADSEGRFRFEHVPPGTYVVRAARGPGAIAVAGPLLVTASEVHGDLTLILPSPPFLHGTVLGPEGETLDGLRLTVVCLGRQGDRKKSQAEVEASLEPDGSYRAGPLLPGPAAVRLEPAGSIHSRSRSWNTAVDLGRELGSVQIPESGDTERNFDARALFPCRVRIAVLAGGQAVSGGSVTAARWSTEEAPTVRVPTDASGVARLRLFPGTWRLRVTPFQGSISSGLSRGGPWQFDSPTPLVVPARSEIETTLNVPLVKGTVTVLDAQAGAPLQNRHFTLLFNSPLNGFAAGTRSDDEGLIQLELAAGTKVELILNVPREPGAPYRKGPSAEIIWTAAGPLSDTLRLHPGEGDQQQ